MGKQTRGHAKEYARRKKLAASRGLSSSQARGHAKPNEVPVSRLKAQGLIKSTNPSAEVKYRKVIKAVAKGASLTKASKKAGISRATVLRLDKEREVLKKDSGTGRFSVQGFSEFGILTKEGKLFDQVVVDKQNASLIGQYWSAVNKVMNGSDANALRPFRGKAVYDINGRKYVFLTDPNDVRSVFDQMSRGEADNFEEKLYRPLRHAA